FHGDGGDVDGGDPPAAFGQPDRVAALAAAQVQGGAGRQAVGLADQQRVDPAGPDLLAVAVEAFPERFGGGGGGIGHAVHRAGAPEKRATILAVPAKTTPASDSGPPRQ